MTIANWRRLWLSSLAFHAKLFTDSAMLMDFSTQYLLHLLELVDQKGFDTQKLCKQVGFDWVEFRQGKMTLSPETMNELWRVISTETQDPYLGLQLGERLNFQALGLIGNVIQHSTTIEEALKNVCSFSNVLTTLFSIRMQQDSDRFELIFEPDPGCLLAYEESVIQAIFAAMVFAMKEYHLLCFERIRPISVEVKTPLSDTQNFERIFRCSVLSKSDRFALTFASDYLSRQIIGADYEVLTLLKVRAESLLQAHLETVKTSHQVRKNLLIQLNNGFPQIEDIALGFNLSVRTLQRRLKEEGTSFHQVLETVKAELATYYLQRDVHLKEIAYALGYADVSSFLRSFKRWTGTTPTLYRKNQ